MAKIKKAQSGIKATADSTKHYTRRLLSDMDMADRSSGDLKKVFNANVNRDAKDLNRQKLKGKPGYDANGFPLKKQKCGGKTLKKK